MILVFHLPGITAGDRGQLANAFACSCDTIDLAIWVPTATGRHLGTLCSQRLLPLDAGNIGDRIGKSMAVKKDRARHCVLGSPIFIEEMADGIVARDPLEIQRHARLSA